MRQYFWLNGEILQNEYFQYFDRSETRHDRAKIGLAGQHDWPPFKNYFEPCHIHKTKQQKSHIEEIVIIGINMSMGQKKSHGNRTHDLSNTGWALYPLSYENSWRARSLTEFICDRRPVYC